MPVALRNLPLPESHLGLLGVGLAMQAIHPMRLPGASGRVVAFGTGALVGGAMATITAATSAAGRIDLAAPDRLVTVGPYAWSRHPMYEAWTALYVAAAVRLRNGWLAALLPVLVILVHRDVGREERRLQPSVRGGLSDVRGARAEVRRAAAGSRPPLKARRETPDMEMPRRNTRPTSATEATAAVRLA